MELKETELEEQDELLKQVQDEIKFGLDSCSTKRQIFRDRLHLYIEPNKSADKISNNTLYSYVQLFQAINYEDKLSVIFKGRQFGDEEYADNLTDAANFDQEEMGLNKINFQRDWDRAMFGVGLRVKTGWDNVRKCPVYCVKDPLSWIPDPFGNHIDKFRFHYFEEQMMKDDMTEDRGFIQSAVEDLSWQENSETSQTQNQKNEATGMNYRDENRLENKLYNIYNGYTMSDGEKYLVTVDESMTKFLRVQKIEAVTKEEREDSTLIEYPVIMSWFSPNRGDPYGVALADLVEDKQKAQQILANLQLINAKFSVLGQTFLYDPKAIKNRNDLLAPNTDPKLIAFDSSSGVPISQSMYPVPRQNLQNDSFLVSQDLAKQIQIDTGINNQSLGVQGDKNITLGESQQIQANANIRLGLNIEVNNWSEKEFWKNWYRCYEEYFARADKKFVRITGGFGFRTLEFRKDDFLSLANPDIIIESKKNIEQMRAKQQVAFAAKLPLILEDPSIPQISKNFAKRYSLKLDGLDKEYINILIPDTYEEMSAKQKITLLDQNDMMGADIKNMDEDHMTYLVLFERARDTEAKYEAIARRKDAIIQMGQNRQPMPQEGGAAGGAANASASQMTSAMIGQGANKTTSLQNIT